MQVTASVRVTRLRTMRCLYFLTGAYGSARDTDVSPSKADSTNVLGHGFTLSKNHQKFFSRTASPNAVSPSADPKKAPQQAFLVPAPALGLSRGFLFGPPSSVRRSPGVVPLQRGCPIGRVWVVRPHHRRCERRRQRSWACPAQIAHWAMTAIKRQRKSLGGTSILKPQ